MQRIFLFVIWCMCIIGCFIGGYLVCVVFSLLLLVFLCSRYLVQLLIFQVCIVVSVFRQVWKVGGRFLQVLVRLVQMVLLLVVGIICVYRLVFRGGSLCQVMLVCQLLVVFGCLVVFLMILILGWFFRCGKKVLILVILLKMWVKVMCCLGVSCWLWKKMILWWVSVLCSLVCVVLFSGWCKFSLWIMVLMLGVQGLIVKWVYVWGRLLSCDMKGF